MEVNQNTELASRRSPERPAFDVEKLEDLVRKYGNTPVIRGADGGLVRKDVMEQILELVGRRPVPASAPSGQGGKVETITMTAYQLRQALEFINPDGLSDELQCESELTFGVVRYDDGGEGATGLCCWNEDTDGVYPLSGEPPKEVSPGAGVVDGSEVANDPGTNGTAPHLNPAPGSGGDLDDKTTAAYAAQRLRLIAVKLGLGDSIPETNAELWACAFSVLGMVRGRLDDVLGAHVGQAVAGSSCSSVLLQVNQTSSHLSIADLLGPITQRKLIGPGESLYVVAGGAQAGSPA